MKAVLQGANTIVVQPTGNGKSLCYQFPPFVTGGTAVIVSPSYLEPDSRPDRGPVREGYCATYLCSTQQDSSVPAAIAAGEFKVVFVTPERMFPGGGSQPNHLMQSLAAEGKLCLIAIDEAHCIFSWQAFRWVCTVHRLHI